MRSLLGNIEYGSEFNLTFSFEVHPGKRIIIVLGKGFIELFIFFVFDFILGSQPDGLVIIDNLPFGDLFFDGLGLFDGFFGFVFIDVFNIDIVVFLFSSVITFGCFSRGSFFFFNFNFFGNLFPDLEFDWEVNKFRVLFDQSFQGLFVGIFTRIFFQVNHDLGTSTKGVTGGVSFDGERIGSG